MPCCCSNGPVGATDQGPTAQISTSTTSLMRQLFVCGHRRCGVSRAPSYGCCASRPRMALIILRWKRQRKAWELAD
eukprot:COSAG01_NODE_4128_length_5325_cov_4.201493_8_plen_76_part_00